jgi:hypothetical protein
VEVESKGFKPYAEDVEAKLGRAIIVDAQLEEDRTSAFGSPRRVSAQVDAGVVFSKLGGVSESARWGLGLGARYWVRDTGKSAFGVGVQFELTSDAWGNESAAPNTAPGCGSPIPDKESSTDIAAFGVGAFAFRVTPRLRLGADAGLGAATTMANTVGGDLYEPSCAAHTGARLAGRAALDVSFALAPPVRLVATPLKLQVHPAYGGARSAPLDASGAWVRFGMGAGIAVDL